MKTAGGILLLAATTAVADTSDFITKLPCSDVVYGSDLGHPDDITDQDLIRLTVMLEFYQDYATRLGVSYIDVAFLAGQLCYETPDRPLADLDWPKPD